MKDFSDIEEKDFEALLVEGGNLRGMQILQGAFAAGVAGFAMIVVVLHVVGMGPEEPVPAAENCMLPILTLVHAVVTLSSWALAFVLFPMLLRQGGRSQGSRSPESAEDPAGRLLGNLRGATILRAAILEAAALLGLIVCLLGVLQGEIAENPLYWLNGLSAFAFIVFAVLTFPTEERLLDLLRRMKREARHG